MEVTGSRKKIGNVELGGKTCAVCISITGKNREEILKQALDLRTKGADLAEWRVDHYLNSLLTGNGKGAALSEGSFDTLCTSVSEILPDLKTALGKVPLIFTFRTKGEGGVCELPLEGYEKLCRMAALSGCADALDVEYVIWREWSESKRGETEFLKSKVSGNLCLMLSNHDFQKTPSEEELLKRLTQMEKLGADIAKIAVMPERAEDVLTLLHASLKAKAKLQIPVITISMGQLGTVSRLAGTVFGSCLTFASTGDGSAPGQIPVELVKDLFVKYARNGQERQ